MLRGMSFRQLLEWQSFDSVEPFGDKRGDWQAAQICATLANIWSKKKFAPNDFLLEFEERPSEPKPRKSWQELKRIGQQMVKLYNTPKRKKVK